MFVKISSRPIRSAVPPRLRGSIGSLKNLGDSFAQAIGYGQGVANVQAGGQVASVLRVSSRNARFQQWESLLSNRSKRHRAGEFLVQGVRPISLAAEFGWRFRALIHDAERPLSSWAENLLRGVDTVQVSMAPDLLAELGEKSEGTPELVAVVEMPSDDPVPRTVSLPRGWRHIVRGAVRS